MMTGALFYTLVSLGGAAAPQAAPSHLVVPTGMAVPITAPGDGRGLAELFQRPAGRALEAAGAPAAGRAELVGDAVAARAPAPDAGLTVAVERGRRAAPVRPACLL